MESIFNTQLMLTVFYWVSSLILATTLYLIGFYKSRSNKINLWYLGWLLLASYLLGGRLVIFFSEFIGLAKIIGSPFFSILVVICSLVTIFMFVTPSRTQQNIQYGKIALTSAIILSVIETIIAFSTYPEFSRDIGRFNTHSPVINALTSQIFLIGVYLFIALGSMSKSSTFLNLSTPLLDDMMSNSNIDSKIYNILVEYLENWIYEHQPTYTADQFSKVGKSVLVNGKKEISEKLYLEGIRNGPPVKLAEEAIEYYYQSVVNQVETVYMKRRKEYLETGSVVTQETPVSQNYPYSSVPSSQPGYDFDSSFSNIKESATRIFDKLTQKEMPKTYKNPGTATVINIFLPGVGHIYAEQVQFGVIVLLFTIFLWPLSLLLIFITRASGFGFFLVGLLFLVYIITYFYQIIDIYNYLKSIEPNYFEKSEATGSSITNTPPVITQSQTMTPAVNRSPIQQTAAPQQQKSTSSKLQELKELNDLLKSGAINQEEFETLKAEIMGKQ